MLAMLAAGQFNPMPTVHRNDTELSVLAKLALNPKTDAGDSRPESGAGGVHCTSLCTRLEWHCR